MDLPAWLPRAASVHPERTALETPEGALSYAVLDGRAALAAGQLARAGVGRGDRVAIALPAGEAFVIALHACLRMGAVATPVDLRLAERERRAQEARAAVVVREPIDEGRIEAGPLAPAGRLTHDLSSPAIVVHTSGSTGPARPVELTYGNLLWSAMGSAVALGLDESERWLCPLPLTHVGGVAILIRSAIAATTVVLHHGFEAGTVAVALAADRITLVSLVPTMLARLLDAGVAPAPTLRWALVGGAALHPSLATRARQAGFPVAETYGLTEACSQVAMRGIPLLCTDVDLAADGEILVGGPTVAPGCAGLDGWLRTGDLGCFDDRGRLVVTGRSAETIVTGGENVAPAEVEAALLDHPAVAEAAVHGVPDPEWGEAVTATVVLRASVAATEEELRAHAGRGLAAYKVPKAIRVVDSLPRTPSGKIRRDRLR